MTSSTGYEIEPSTFETLLASNDPLLAALIRADESCAEGEIERLIVDVARPVIARIAARYTGLGKLLAIQDMEDVSSAVSLRLLDRLRRTRSSPGEAMHDVVNYVSTLTYNEINDQLRRRFPQRTRLKNRLRYVLTHDPRLVLWNVPGALACGLRAWNGAADPLRSVPMEPPFATRAMRDRERPADALVALFAAIGKPVELETLLHFTAAIWHIADLRAVDLEGTVAVDPAEAVTTKMERLDFLRTLWSEIRELRPLQRKALLLNLRDGAIANVVSLLVLTGTARFDDIAAALELTPDELSGVWNELPLDDLRIAQVLNITRQQVINLRKAARRRLQRRMFR